MGAVANPTTVLFTDVVGSLLRMRVGVNVGGGTPLVIARRLCDRAPAGTILCSSTVAGLVAGRAMFGFRELGPLALKGIVGPVRVCEVCAPDATRTLRPAPLEIPPLPVRLAREEQFPLAGRRRELDALQAAWRRVEQGDYRLVVLGGEPGIGKTRVAAEMAHRAHAGGAAVLYGRADEEMHVPFQPFVEALDHVVAHTPDDALRSRLGPHADELVRLVPGLSERLPLVAPPLRSDPETERYRLFEATAAWLAAMAAERPTLLVLDDLHWAEKATLLLRHVARALGSAPVMIVGTHRDTEPDDGGEALRAFLADLHRIEGVERLTLRGLAEGDVVELVTEAARAPAQAATRDLARTLHAETGGNPFFVSEVLRHLLESGRLDQPRAVEAIPPAVRDVVLHRVDRLPPATAETLRRAAVIGRDFDLMVLRALDVAPEDDVLAALEHAVAAHLVDETGVDAWRFSHALVRAALYETLGASRRTRLHRRIADVMAQHRPDDVGMLAHHYALAGTASVDAAIEYTTRAGDRAVTRLAHHEAVELYRRALALLADAPDAARRCELLLRLGCAERSAGDAAHRDTLLQAGALARQLGDVERLVRAALANNRGWVSQTGAVDRQRVATLEAALAAFDERDGAPRAMLQEQAARLFRCRASPTLNLPNRREQNA